LKETVPDNAVLTCLYRTLQLGFVGQFRCQNDERREDVIHKLKEHVQPFQLAQDTPIVARPRSLGNGRRLYWLSWTVGVLVLATLWYGLSSSLTALVNQIVGLG